jgi:hypothetical protein
MAKTSGKSSGGKSGAAASTPKVVAPAPKVAEALLSTTSSPTNDKDSWDESALDDNEYARFVTRNEEAGVDASDVNPSLSSLDPDAELSEEDGVSSDPNGAVTSDDEVISEDGSSSDGSSEDNVFSADGPSEGDVFSADDSSTDGSSTEGSSTDGSSEDDTISADGSSADEIAPDGGDWTLDSSASDWVDLSDSDTAAE